MVPQASYRRDIDGLRALAVLPVLLYHAHVPGFSGGFVGVDVFFVISGFLITGIIAREIDRGSFSILSFYERRARRILPALFVVLAAVLAAASWLYLPGDFENVPPSALMALLFLANLWFVLNTGYFAGGSETMPLLHCWSLGVEEQFYIGFPVLLLLVARYAPRWRAAVIAGVALFSFALAWATQANGDGFAFYLLPARAWELFVGALLALGALPAVRWRLFRETIAFVGIVAIVGAAMLYDSQTVFPGVAALAPVIGAAMLIHCAPGTLAGRFLSLKPAVWIGLISYSLYLWHWPIIVFAEYAQGDPLSGWQRVLAIAGSVALAWISWRFVERPFRSPGRFSRQRIFALSGASMAAVGAVSLGLITLGGWPGRFPPQTMHFAAAKHDVSPRRSACLSNEIGGDRPDCTLGAHVEPQALLWGDSHGVEIAWAMGERMAQEGGAVIQRTRGSCPPVLGYDVARDPGCVRFNRAVMREIETQTSLRTVYLAAFWAGGAYDQPGMIAKIDATIARLQAADRQVVVIGPVPSQPFNVPRALARAAARGDEGKVMGRTRQSYEKESLWFRRNFTHWRAQGVTIMDPATALVGESRTRIVANGEPLYFDSHHLSITGARAVLAAARAP